MTRTPHRLPTNATVKACPLCRSNACRLYLHAEMRDYFLCSVCRLIFVPRTFWPASDEEKVRYEQHQNSVTDKSYVAFLEQLSAPLARIARKGVRGLDFGAGPAPDAHPALCEILKNAGLECLPFDPFFFPEMPNGPFDFIASSETFEHFRRPAEQLWKIHDNLKTGGLLAVMTAFWDKTLFMNNWHYRRDFTHLCFYRLETFAWIQENFGFSRLWTDYRRVIILKKL